MYNDGSGGDVDFTFSYLGGGSSTQTVTLSTGIFGLQFFSFNQANLSSVVFAPTTTTGPWIQFDDVGVNGAGAVPEPATWAMMLLGLSAASVAMRRRPQAAVSFS